MRVVRVVCLVAAFLAELANLFAVALAGFSAGALPLRWVLGIGLPLLLAVAWGLLAAPRAALRLTGRSRAAFVSGWYACGVAALLIVAPAWVAATFVIAVLAVAAGLRATARVSTMLDGGPPPGRR